MLVVSACTAAFGQPEKTPAQYVKAAAAAFSKPRTLAMQGVFNDGDVRYSLDVVVARDIGFQGNVGVRQIAIQNLTFVNQSAYVSGGDVAAALGDRAGRIAGSRPVLLKLPDFGPAIVRLSEENAFAEAFLNGRPDLQKTGTASIAGHKAVKLSDKDGSIYIASDGTGLPLRVDSQSSKTGGRRYTSVLLNFFDFDKPVTIAAPKDVVDFDDPKTLPERYSLVDFQADNCDSSGCGANITVKNEAGAYAADPAPTATLKLTKDSDKSDLGSCSVPIPLVANAATTVVNCRVSGDAWKRFAVSGGGYTSQVTISNALYDSGASA
jgi:hypothetical protein